MDISKNKQKFFGFLLLTALFSIFLISQLFFFNSIGYFEVHSKESTIKEESFRYLKDFKSLEISEISEISQNSEPIKEDKVYSRSNRNSNDELEQNIELESVQEEVISEVEVSEVKFYEEVISESKPYFINDTKEIRCLRSRNNKHCLNNYTNDTLLPIGLSNCSVLNESSRTYILKNDISNYAGSCFIFEADNIILDGNGYSISGTNDVYNIYYGVLAEGRNNISVINLTISNFGDVYLDYDTTDDGGGVKLYNTNNSKISFVSTSGDNTGINLENSYNNNLFSVNSFNDYRGIRLINSLNNSLSGSSLESSGVDLMCSSSDTNYNKGLIYSSQYGCENWINI